ncbi:MAG: AgmX/PglI C-terminal domain-containing protein [Polyangiaceae bacterium]
MRSCWCLSFLVLAGACSSPPPPKPPPPPDPPKEEAPPPAEPVVQEELGSIDNDAIDGAFGGIENDIESCLVAGRARVSTLGGDVTVFMRIDTQGHVRWSYLQASTLGDRDTEKCLLDLMSRSQWPAPVGGEAEVTHSFGGDSASRRSPVSWESEKVTFAIDASQPTRRAINQCKHGANGTIDLTGYVVAGAPPAPGTDSKKPGVKKHRKKPAKAKAKAKPEGHFRAIGAASASKDAAGKIDCVIDSVKSLPLPSPGSSTAKVSFSL